MLSTLQEFLKKLLGGSQSDPDRDWCLVGNVKRLDSEVSTTEVAQKGTKHFSEGTKVYCFPVLWGDGYERILVIGRHRGSKRFVTMVLPSKHVSNWRVKVVHHPEVLRRLNETTFDFSGERMAIRKWNSKSEVEEYVRFLISRDDEARAT